MIRSYTAHTGEVDDVELAVSEILEQLQPEKNCLGNTMILVTCYYEFATNGIVAELYRRMKCPVIGTTTTSLRTSQGSGHLDLALIMITSDDVTFTAACSASLANEIEAPLADMYKNALAGHSEKPKLILSAAPLLLHNAGDYYVDALSKISGGVPNFGTLAVDDSINYENSYVIFNDRAEKECYAVILASGNISPKFMFSSISPDKILRHSAVITESEGNFLKKVNDLSVYDFLKTLGMVHNGKIREGLNSIPLVINYSGGGRAISKVLIFVDENGYGVCGGVMPQGATLSIGVWDKDDVVETTLQTLQEILAGGADAIIAYSCVGRSLALGTDNMVEGRSVNEVIGKKTPYLFAYSGGEICPICDGTTTNHFHNNTVIVCAL